MRKKYEKNNYLFTTGEDLPGRTANFTGNLLFHEEKSIPGEFYVTGIPLEEVLITWYSRISYIYTF